MTDHEEPPPAEDERLAELFVDVTGDTSITDRQDPQDEAGKAVIEGTVTDPQEGER